MKSPKTDKTPPKVSSPIRALQRGRSDLWKLRFQDIEFAKDSQGIFAFDGARAGLEGNGGLLNPRVDFGDLESLARQIGEFGVRVPIPGAVDKKRKKFVASHGERRLLAHRMAVEKGWLDPKSEKALIPVVNEHQATTDAERVELHVILNNGKPLDQFEQGRAFDYLAKQEEARILETAESITQKEHSLILEVIADRLGYSKTHVADCLKLVRGTAPELQKAVTEGKIAATTAIDLAKEVPAAEQPAVVDETLKNAEKRGKNKATAQDVPVPIGKAAQAARKEESLSGWTSWDALDDANKKIVGKKYGWKGKENEEHEYQFNNTTGKVVNRRRIGADPFEGKHVGAATTDKDGNFLGGPGLIEEEIRTTAKGIRMKILSAALGDSYHVGLEVKWPGQRKGDGFLRIPPSIGGQKTDNPKLAAILGAQLIRAEIESKTLKPEVKAVAVEDIDAWLAEKTKGEPEHVPAPVTPPKLDPVAALKDTIEGIRQQDAEKDRLKTAKKILTFLRGRLDAKDLAKFILGIE